MTAPGAGPGPDEGDPLPNDKRELLEAFEGVVSREREKIVASRSLPMARRTHVLVLILCALSWFSLAYVWLARPQWLFPDDPTAALGPAEREARQRFAIYLERERVLDFRATHHRLPSSLAEAGDVEAGVDYAVSGDSTFVVSAMIRDSLLTLNESQAADDLLKPAGLSPSRPK